VNDDEQSPWILRRPNCVCIFCGATRETHPERDFVTNGRTDICASCIDEAQFLVNNKDRLSIPAMMDSLKKELDVLAGE